MSNHLKFRSAQKVGESDLLSPLLQLFPPSIPSSTPRISDLLLSSQGCDLGKLLDLTATLERRPTLESAHELPESGSVGNPDYFSRYSIFHRFSTLAHVFFLSVFQNFQFGSDTNGLLWVLS
ncbi:hypothetical protein AVEN_120769-1 [Araneus ventricosus]|uniref:Uncharacterized protein n=1 Tax=Araneus ventricosus TaxID=182803 RepID=A0A4Y2RUQ2_ARAVE|nr:hypothetical protein AVEN_120769-1 [Araneus ventricosus]